MYKLQCALAKIMRKSFATIINYAIFAILKTNMKLL